MSRKATLLFLAVLASQAAAADKSLFDGKTLKGWENHGAESWHVRDGAIACDGSAPSWIGTAESFSDFVLTLEFKGPASVNSGVFLRSQKEGPPHVTGYELQIWDYQPAGFNTGSLVNTVKAPETKILADKWNKYEITAQGDHFVIVLNGKTLLDAHDSKHASGVIGFQCQKDNAIQFRNIRIRTIAPKK
jgi:3-keto-disaccharide hydrolase